MDDSRDMAVPRTAPPKPMELRFATPSFTNASLVNHLNKSGLVHVKEVDTILSMKQPHLELMVQPKHFTFLLQRAVAQTVPGLRSIFQGSLRHKIPIWFARLLKWQPLQPQLRLRMPPRLLDEHLP